MNDNLNPDQIEANCSAKQGDPVTLTLKTQFAEATFVFDRTDEGIEAFGYLMDNLETSFEALLEAAFEAAEEA